VRSQPSGSRVPSLAVSGRQADPARTSTPRSVTRASTPTSYAAPSSACRGPAKPSEQTPFGHRGRVRQTSRRLTSSGHSVFLTLRRRRAALLAARHRASGDRPRRRAGDAPLLLADAPGPAPQRERGPHRTQIVAHEDVLMFRKPAKRLEASDTSHKRVGDTLNLKHWLS
jgi:hypothetical protein